MQNVMRIPFLMVSECSLIVPSGSTPTEPPPDLTDTVMGTPKCPYMGIQNVRSPPYWLIQDDGTVVW